jgi:hypothetical protein
MQISRVASGPLTIRHQDPSVVHDRLEQLVDQLDDLGTRVERATRAGAVVGAEWPGQVRAAATQLRFAADSVRRLGGDREALLGAALLDDAQDVDAFADELRSAHATNDRFGATHSDWLERLTRPANDAQLALAVIERAPARP